MLGGFYSVALGREQKGLGGRGFSWLFKRIFRELVRSEICLDEEGFYSDLLVTDLMLLEIDFIKMGSGGGRSTGWQASRQDQLYVSCCLDVTPFLVALSFSIFSTLLISICDLLFCIIDSSAFEILESMPSSKSSIASLYSPTTVFILLVAIDWAIFTCTPSSFRETDLSWLWNVFRIQPSLSIRWFLSLYLDSSVRVSRLRKDLLASQRLESCIYNSFYYEFSDWRNRGTEYWAELLAVSLVLAGCGVVRRSLRGVGDQEEGFGVDHREDTSGCHIPRGVLHHIQPGCCFFLETLPNLLPIRLLALLAQNPSACLQPRNYSEIILGFVSVYHLLNGICSIFSNSARSVFYKLQSPLGHLYRALIILCVLILNRYYLGIILITLGLVQWWVLRGDREKSLKEHSN